MSNAFPAVPLAKEQRTALSTAREGAPDASTYCPVCSQKLESRKCKLICTACGYYMSCSDYY